MNCAMGSSRRLNRSVADSSPTPRTPRFVPGSGRRELKECQIEKEHLLAAIRALAFTVDGNVRRPIDYKNLGSEELGSIYESLLELHPDLNTAAGTFELKTAAGHERKTTGSY